MYATIRRLQCQIGKASEVARLINDEYLPQLDDVEGAVPYLRRSRPTPARSC